MDGTGENVKLKRNGVWAANDLSDRISKGNVRFSGCDDWRPCSRLLHPRRGRATMKVQKAMLQTMGKKITWRQAAEILGISGRLHGGREATVG